MKFYVQMQQFKSQHRETTQLENLSFFPPNWRLWFWFSPYIYFQLVRPLISFFDSSFGATCSIYQKLFTKQPKLNKLFSQIAAFEFQLPLLSLSQISPPGAEPPPSLPLLLPSHVLLRRTNPYFSQQAAGYIQKVLKHSLICCATDSEGRMALKWHQKPLVMVGRGADTMPDSVLDQVGVETYWQTHFFKSLFLNQFTGKLKTNLEHESSHEAWLMSRSGNVHIQARFGLRVLTFHGAENVDWVRPSWIWHR